MFKKKDHNKLKDDHRKKSRKTSSKNPSFINFGLKDKLRCWVLSPLFLGILATVGVSFAIILYVEPIWFDSTGAEIIDNQKNSMKSITESVGDYMKEYFQRIVNELLFVNDYTKKVLTKDPHYYNAAKIPMFFNYYEISTEASQKAIKSNPFAFSTWYVDDKIKSYADLSEENKENINLAKNLDIVVRPLYLNGIRLQQAEQKSGYDGIYHIFHKGNLLYYYPCPILATDLDLISRNDTCFKETGKLPTCFTYYLYNLAGWKKLGMLLSISPPYVRFKSASEKKDETSILDLNLTCTFCLTIPESDNVTPKITTCFDAQISDLQQHLSTSSALEIANSTLLVLRNKIDDPIGDLIIYYNSEKNSSGFVEKSLISAEFEIDDSNDPEIIRFKEIFTEFRAGNTTYTNSYMKKQKKYLISLYQVYINPSFGDEKIAVFSIGIVVSVERLLSRFNDVKDEIKDKLLYQLLIISSVIVVILLISLQTINYIANSIVSPMDELVKKVKKLQDGDEEVEIIENFTEKSFEINCLYRTFSKLANVLKYANKAFFEGNDAEALIRFAQALKLFSDLNNRKAMASIYNNIGNIHLIGERFEEAIENYRNAVDLTEEELKKTAKFKKEKTTTTNFKKLTGKNSERDSHLSGDSGSRFSNRDSSAKRSTVGPQTIAEHKAILENQIANRQYQLVNALIQQAEKNKINNWDEIIKRLNKVLRTDIENKQKNAQRIVKTHILISNAFLELGDYTKSYQHVCNAEEKLREYQKIYDYDKASSSSEIPPDILLQKIILQKGMFLKKYGKTKSAALKFTECLEIGKIYDPEIRKKCLEQLKEIFEMKNLLEEAPNIPKLLENTVSKKNKDIVFALDFSESMTHPGRKAYALKAILTVFDNYMKDTDRVGFVRFNKNCDVVFGLSEKGKHRLYLRNCIQNLDKAQPEGETAFYNALKESLKLYKKAEKKNHSCWIVALTDGEDNASRINYEAIYNRLKKSEVNLIIVGLALNKDMISILRELCLATPEGVFIETADNNDLEIAFQSITDIIYGTSDLIIESWS